MRECTILAFFPVEPNAPYVGKPCLCPKAGPADFANTTNQSILFDWFTFSVLSKSISSSVNLAREETILYLSSIHRALGGAAVSFLRYGVADGDCSMGGLQSKIRHTG